MHKADIATRIHQQAGIPLDEAAKLLDWFLVTFSPSRLFKAHGNSLSEEGAAAEGEAIEGNLIDGMSKA